MAQLQFLRPGGIMPVTYYKLDVKGGMAIKMFGHLVRKGHDAYGMARLIDQRRFNPKRIPHGSLLDVVLRARAKGLWFDVDFDQVKQCFFIQAIAEIPALEDHPDASQKDQNGFTWWPSQRRITYVRTSLDNVLRAQEAGKIWLKKNRRDKPGMPTLEEIRTFTELIGLERINYLFLHPKDLGRFCRAVQKDELWDTRYCDLDYRVIVDEDDKPISFTDFRVPRGTILGEGLKDHKKGPACPHFAVIVEPDGVE